MPAGLSLLRIVNSELLIVNWRGGLGATRLAWRRGLPAHALRRLGLRLLAAAVLIVLLAPQTIGRGLEAATDALRLRTAFGLGGFGFGLGARIELAADQFDH